MNADLQTMILKLATRFLQGSFQEQMDELARCQVLEGAMGIKMGTWSRNPRRGLIKAKAELGNKVDPSWFEPSRLYVDCLNIVSKILGSVTSKDATGFFYEKMMGVLKNPQGQETQKDTNAVYWSSGRHKADGILSGKETPQKITATAAFYFRNKAISELKTYRTEQKNQSPDYDPFGQDDANVSEDKQIDTVRDIFYDRVHLDPIQVMSELMAANTSAGMEFRHFLLDTIGKALKSDRDVEMAMKWLDFTEKHPGTVEKGMMDTDLLRTLGYEFDMDSRAIRQQFSRVKKTLAEAIPKAVKNSPKINKLIEDHWALLAKEYGVRLARTLTTILDSYKGRVASDTSMVQLISQRYLRASIASALEMVARAQILEGAAGLPQGTWSKNPRQGLIQAKLHFSETDIDPTWFLPTNLYKAAQEAMQSVQRQYKMSVSPEDVLQGFMAGIGAKGEQVLSLFRYAGITRGEEIIRGSGSPDDIEGTVRAYAANRAMSYAKTHARRQKNLKPDDTENSPGSLENLREQDQDAILIEALLGRDAIGRELRSFCYKIVLAMKPGIAEYGLEWLNLIARNGKVPKQRDILYAMGREIDSKNQVAVGRALKSVLAAITKAAKRSPDFQDTLQTVLTKYELSGYRAASAQMTE
jgi:hypothetical protein